MTKRFTAFLAALFALNQVSWAVPPLHPDQSPDFKGCHVKRITPEAIQRFGSLRAAVIQPASGQQNIAMILVRFPSADPVWTSGSPGLSAGASTNFANYRDEMHSYYAEVSYGKLDLRFKFFGDTAGVNGDDDPGTAGSFPMDHPMEYYGCGDNDAGCNAPATASGADLIAEAILKAHARSAFMNSTNFQTVLVMHAGYGNETTSNPPKNGNIWSAYYQDDPSKNVYTITNSGAGFSDGATFPELEAEGYSPLGVMCHEFAHILTLPDLYNTSVQGGASVVGNWDLMDAGPYLNKGANPAHMGAWDRQKLEWESTASLTGRSSNALHPVTTLPPTQPPTILRLGAGKEYFLVEYRSTTAGVFDQGIPGSGLLIWHIDDNINDARGFSGTNTVNTGSPHNGVSIVTADGLTLSSGNHGDAGNLFPNGRPTFDSPLSDLYDGTPTGIILANIQGAGGAVSFDAANLNATAAVSILKVVNYPNPAGTARYPHPKGPGHTTLQFQLSKPAKDYQINIYTLSGDLVRKVSRDDIAFQLLDRSSDNKFIYEYVWDLTNGDGAHVAPGVYLFLVRADGQSHSAKAVIIR